MFPFQSSVAAAACFGNSIFAIGSWTIGVGLMARWKSANDYYFLGWLPTEGATIFRKRQAVTTTLANVPMTLPAGWNDFVAEVQGSSLRLYINGALVVSTTNAALAAGAAGLRMWGKEAFFDDFVVESR